jgi:hypothetical protein
MLKKRERKRKRKTKLGTGMRLSIFSIYKIYRKMERQVGWENLIYIILKLCFFPFPFPFFVLRSEAATAEKKRSTPSTPPQPTKLGSPQWGGEEIGIGATGEGEVEKVEIEELLMYKVPPKFPPFDLIIVSILYFCFKILDKYSKSSLFSLQRSTSLSFDPAVWVGQM